MLDFQKLEKIAEYKDGTLEWVGERDINAVYVILVKNEYYIGSSYYTFLRIKQHLKYLLDGNHHSNKLQSKFNDIKSFEVYSLDRGITKNQMLSREYEYIKKYSPSLNIQLSNKFKSHIKTINLTEEADKILANEDLNQKVREWWNFAAQAKTPELKAQSDDMFYLLNKELSLEERKQAGKLHREYLRERARNKKYGEVKCEDFDAKKHVEDIEEFLNFSAIAKEYFGKDRAWLHQRINGSIVNGKKAAFTEEEKKIFVQALQDVCARISDSITTIH